MMPRQNTNLPPLAPAPAPKRQQSESKAERDFHAYAQSIYASDLPTNMPQQQFVQAPVRTDSGMDYGERTALGAQAFGMPKAGGFQPMHEQPAGQTPLQTLLQRTNSYFDPDSATVAAALETVYHPDPRECFQLSVPNDDFQNVTVDQEEKWIEELYDALTATATLASQYPTLKIAGQAMYYNKDMTKALQDVKSLLADPILGRRAKAWCRLAIDQVWTVHSHGIPRKASNDKLDTESTCSQRARKLIDITKANKRIAFDVARGKNLDVMAQAPDAYLNKKIQYSKSNERKAWLVQQKAAAAADDSPSTSADDDTDDEGPSKKARARARKPAKPAKRAKSAKKTPTTKEMKRKTPEDDADAQISIYTAKKQRGGSGPDHSILSASVPAGGEGAMQALGNYSFQTRTQGYGRPPSLLRSRDSTAENAHLMMPTGATPTGSTTSGHEMQQLMPREPLHDETSLNSVPNARPSNARRGGSAFASVGPPSMKHAASTTSGDFSRSDSSYAATPGMTHASATTPGDHSHSTSPSHEAFKGSGAGLASLQAFSGFHDAVGMGYVRQGADDGVLHGLGGAFFNTPTGSQQQGQELDGFGYGKEKKKLPLMKDFADDLVEWDPPIRQI